MTFYIYFLKSPCPISVGFHSNIKGLFYYVIFSDFCVLTYKLQDTNAYFFIRNIDQIVLYIVRIYIRIRADSKIFEIKILGLDFNFDIDVRNGFRA